MLRVGSDRHAVTQWIALEQIDQTRSEIDSWVLLSSSSRLPFSLRKAWKWVFTWTVTKKISKSQTIAQDLPMDITNDQWKCWRLSAVHVILLFLACRVAHSRLSECETKTHDSDNRTDNSVTEWTETEGQCSSGHLRVTFIQETHWQWFDVSVSHVTHTCTFSSVELPK